MSILEIFAVEEEANVDDDDAKFSATGDEVASVASSACEAKVVTVALEFSGRRSSSAAIASVNYKFSS